MADTQITNLPVVAVPSTYLVKDGVEIQLKAVFAEVDGSGAGGTFLPAVVIKSDSGHVVSQAADQNVSVAGGGSASVSWFPRLRRVKKAVPDCVSLGKANGLATLTTTLTQAVPADGLLQYVMIGVGVNVPVFNPGFPANPTDSKGVAGWTTNAPHNEAQIGGVSQGLGVSPHYTIGLVVSGVRPCTAGDLVAGDTVTAVWDTGGAANFYTAGLLIWMKAQNPAVFQDPGFGPEYAEGNSHPDFGPSMTRLSWYTDFGANFDHFHSACHVITGMGAYPARSGYTPINGTPVDEIATGQCSIAAACFPAGVGVVPDPGGTWLAGAQTMILGNYQGATLLP